MSLFKPKPLYENGNANTYVKTAYLMTAIYTESVAATAAGSQLSIYDRDITTYYTLGTNTAADAYLQWQFNSTKKFKSIYFYVNKQAAGTVYLQTSLDGSAWTNQDSSAATGDFALIADDVRAKYIKVFWDLSVESNTIRCYAGEAVI